MTTIALHWRRVLQHVRDARPQPRQTGGLDWTRLHDGGIARIEFNLRAAPWTTPALIRT
jgi:hypothetical protein